MVRLVAIALTCALLPAVARSCDTALVLAIDVSNSVDPAEYRLQVDGLADALADPDIVAAALSGQVALTVLQWSAANQQAVTSSWTRIHSRDDLDSFAAQVRATPRAYTLGGTAPAEAINAALHLFEDVPDCRRKVIDVSGDGTPNDGDDVGPGRQLAEKKGVTINGIAIESLGLAISQFYARNLVTRDGFVITARAHRDYPRAIRIKILRELSRVVG